MGVYSLDFGVECPALSLSTTKSVIRGFVDVPFQPSSTTTGGTEPQPLQALGQAVDCDRLRYYLAAVARLDVEMSAEVVNQGELDYLQAKRGLVDPKMLTVEDLDRRYTMARLVAASLGERVVDLSGGHWARVKEMEEARLQRVMGQAQIMAMEGRGRADLSASQ